MMRNSRAWAGIALIAAGVTLAAYAPASPSHAAWIPTGPFEFGKLCVPGTTMTAAQQTAACAKSCGNCIAVGAGPLWGWNNGECVDVGPGCTRGVNTGVTIPMFNCNSSWCGTSFWTGAPQYLCTAAIPMPPLAVTVSDCI